MDLLDFNAVIHLEIKEIDTAIEKTERLLALLRKLQGITSANQ